ncbi:hypothetical protein Tco_0707584 [Tanacetum coccineum]|uniref:Uncharacterized protein n=1 Tax=Tanacetum coccineum TaxID=301880 RepID=A0ABQ4YAQ2_9ASTR
MLYLLNKLLISHPDIAPPTRTDDQILPINKWVPIGKSNSVLNIQNSQRNPIFSIAVAILKNTNFFRAFTSSSTIPAIYIQQFWDTIDALDITPANDNNPFEAPPSSDTVIEYVNTLGYPSTLRNVSAMSAKEHHVSFSSLGYPIHHSDIDYAERIWEEFVQSHTNLHSLTGRQLGYGSWGVLNEPSGHAESSLLYVELGLTDSETESDEEVSPEINAGTQDEGQAGPNPSEQDEGQAGPNPGIQDEGQAGSNLRDAAESQPHSSHVVHAGPNLEHMDFEVTNASS